MDTAPLLREVHSLAAKGLTPDTSGAQVCSSLGKCRFQMPLRVSQDPHIPAPLLPISMVAENLLRFVLLYHPLGGKETHLTSLVTTGGGFGEQEAKVS